MDGVRFDDLVRALLGGTSRRGLLRRLSELPLAGGLAALLVNAGESDAKKRKKKNKNRKNQQKDKRRQKDKVRIEGPCGDGSGPDNRCTKHTHCCTRHCDKKKRRCRCLKEGQPCTNDRLCCPGRTGRTCQDGACQPQTCAGTGQSCSSTRPCCAGLTCLEGGCQEQACAVAGESCAAGIFCCPDLVCVDGACTDPPSTCADTCGGCCDGETCEPGTADVACGTGGAACVACTGGTSCGGGAMPGVCGCTPITCQAAGAECGAIADGCGNPLNCGSCSSGEVCEDNQCVTPPCGDVCASGCQLSSLQQAIDEAGTGATLRLCAETYGGTFTINKSLTLIGAGDGEDGTVLDGQQNGRVVIVDEGLTVALHGLRITGGQVSGQGGGGVANSGSLTLTACTVVNNTANLGGGIINSGAGGTLEMTGCTVAGNQSIVGGGIYNGGEATLTNCSVTGNVVTAGDALGGGIQNGGTLTLSGGTVSGNEAGNLGGGIFNIGTVTLQGGVTVTANHATNDGGGIYNDGGVGLGTSSCSGSSSVSNNTPNDCVEVNDGDCGAC